MLGRPPRDDATPKLCRRRWTWGVWNCPWRADEEEEEEDEEEEEEEEDEEEEDDEENDTDAEVDAEAEEEEAEEEAEEEEGGPALVLGRRMSSRPPPPQPRPSSPSGHCANHWCASTIPHRPVNAGSVECGGTSTNSFRWLHARSSWREKGGGEHASVSC